MNDFLDGMQASYEDMEETFGETFLFGDVVVSAISIEDIDFSDAAMLGGQLASATTTIYIQQATFNAAGLANEKVIVVRGNRSRILAIAYPGDGTLTLTCGPVGIKAFR